MDYKYTTQLGPTDIRLLQVVSRGPVDLRFRVITISRRYRPAYTAVSYTWGDEQATHKIFLDGSVFKVRPNLWHCLYNLAGFASRENSMISQLYIWVDAICIDQSNLQERNDQVRNMDETYRNARIVSVWLGLVPGSPATATLRSPDEAFLEALDGNDLDWRRNAIELAKRPYWNRFWVIQEMLLATCVFLFCGNSALEITEFKSMLCGETGIDEFSHDLPQDQLQQVPALPLIIGRSLDRYPELCDTLQALLSRHSQADCKDPRDRVYSLIGLVSPDERQLLARVFPDYSLSEDEVFILTQAHLTQTQPGELNSRDLFQDIRLDQHNVFSALRIASYAKRQSILQRADKIDWLGLESPEHARYQLELSEILHDDRAPEPFEPRLRELQAILNRSSVYAAAITRESRRDYSTSERSDWDLSHRETRSSRKKMYVWTIIVLISTLTGLNWYGMLPRLPFKS